MPQDFLASLTSRPAGEAGARADIAGGPPQEARPAEVAEFLGLIAAAETVRDAPATPATGAAPAQGDTDVPDDPLAALLSAFSPEGDDAATEAALPDWLRAALLGSGTDGAADAEGRMGSAMPGARVAAGTAGPGAGPDGAGRIALVARTGGTNGAEAVGGTSAAGSAEIRVGGMTMAEADGTAGPDPQGNAGDGLPGGPDTGERAAETGRTPVVPSADHSTAPVSTAPVAAAGVATAGKAESGRAGAPDAEAKRTGAPSGPAAAASAFGLRAAFPAGLRSESAPEPTASSGPAPTGLGTEAASPDAADLPAVRAAAPVPDGAGRPEGPMPTPAPAAAAATTIDAAALTAAGAAGEALPNAAEPPRPAAAPPPPVALPQLRDAMAERVRALAEEAGDDSVRIRTATGTAEVELAPAELGRLRLQLSTTERGLHLTVLVDRPESVDAVRRHLDGLHRSLMAEGVTLDGFDIGTGGGAGTRGQEQAAGQGRPRQSPPGPGGGTASGAPAPQADAPPPAPGRTAPGRLDIRI